MKKHFQINNFKIGKNHPTFIIAEAGINHNGSLKLAKQMVDLAKKAGVSCIKFQTHISEEEMIRTSMTPGNISKKSLWDIIKSVELTEGDELKIKKYCESKKILFLSTPFSKMAVDRLERLNIPAYKIGSGELTNHELINYVSQTKKPVMLSTGMSTMSEINSAVNILKNKNIPYAILETTSIYPAKYNEMRLGMISKFIKKFNVPIGLSDHSIGNYISFAAVALGASIIERHFTLDKKMNGPDQKMSLNNVELLDLVKGIRAIEAANNSVKTIQNNEQIIRNFARGSIVTIQNIQKNEKFSRNNIGIKRPGNGKLSPKNFNSIIGKKSKKSLSLNHQLTINDII